MKASKKILGFVLAAALLMTAAVFGTLAYLTSSDQVTNVFTVGAVDIKLDEAEVNPDGTPVQSSNGRVQRNEYKLIPGHSYTKDPMVTVLEGSEQCYVRMHVTINKLAELDDMFDPDGANLSSIFTGFDASAWSLVNPAGVRDTDANTITYEFRYVSTVAAETADVELEPLFTALVVPGFLTGDQLADLADMTIQVTADAIQADGFPTAAEAWTAFDA